MRTDLKPGAVQEARFAAGLRRARTERGWSQADVADKAQALGLTNIHPNTVSRIESGERPIRLGEAAAIAAIFEATVQDMTAAHEVDQVRIRLLEHHAATQQLITAAHNYTEVTDHLRADTHTLEHWLNSPAAKNDRAGHDLADDALQLAQAATLLTVPTILLNAGLIPTAGMTP